MKRTALLKSSFILLCALSFFVTGCYSVFSGGVGGKIVDAESTSSPKSGIADVDIYAYTSSKDCNSDFNSWTEGSVFVPQAEYYGHTTTGTDGTFTLSKLVWKAGKPDFGKDADYTEIYLLFYNENYGLTKGSTVIISDSSTDTVYAELTKIRKETAITLNFQDVATNANTSEAVYVEISVPQTTESITDAKPEIYKADITGTGVVTVSYPRWQNAEDKAASKETEPEIQITYYQNTDVVTWMGCKFDETDGNDFSFIADDERKSEISKVIKGSSYSLTLYGKATKFNVPSFSGQWGNEAKDNGVTLQLLRSCDEGATYTIDCGSVETEAQTLGTSSTEKNGTFSNLGTGYWLDYSYTGKTSTGYYKVTDGTSSVEKAVATDRTSVTIQK